LFEEPIANPFTKEPLLAFVSSLFFMILKKNTVFGLELRFLSIIHYSGFQIQICFLLSSELRTSSMSMIGNWERGEPQFQWFN
jgi:hypothetical protein